MPLIITRTRAACEGWTSREPQQDRHPPPGSITRSSITTALSSCWQWQCCRAAATGGIRDTTTATLNKEKVPRDCYRLLHGSCTNQGLAFLQPFAGLHRAKPCMLLQPAGRCANDDHHCRAAGRFRRAHAQFHALHGGGPIPVVCLLVCWFSSLAWLHAGRADRTADFGTIEIHQHSCRVQEERVVQPLRIRSETFRRRSGFTGKHRAYRAVRIAHVDAPRA